MGIHRQERTVQIEATETFQHVVVKSAPEFSYVHYALSDSKTDLFSAVSCAGFIPTALVPELSFSIQRATDPLSGRQDVVKACPSIQLQTGFAFFQKDLELLQLFPPRHIANLLIKLSLSSRPEATLLDALDEDTSLRIVQAEPFWHSHEFRDLAGELYPHCEVFRLSEELFEEPARADATARLQDLKDVFPITDRVVKHLYNEKTVPQLYALLQQSESPRSADDCFGKLLQAASLPVEKYAKNRLTADDLFLWMPAEDDFRAAMAAKPDVGFQSRDEQPKMYDVHWPSFQLREALGLQPYTNSLRAHIMGRAAARKNDGLADAAFKKLLEFMQKFPTSLENMSTLLTSSRIGYDSEDGSFGEAGIYDATDAITSAVQVLQALHPKLDADIAVLFQEPLLPIEQALIWNSHFSFSAGTGLSFRAASMSATQLETCVLRMLQLASPLPRPQFQKLYALNPTVVSSQRLQDILEKIDNHPKLVSSLASLLPTTTLAEFQQRLQEACASTQLSDTRKLKRL